MAPFLDERSATRPGIHRVSQRAKNAIEEARERAAELIGAQRHWRSCSPAVEPRPTTWPLPGRHWPARHRRGVVTSAIEHEAVLETARFCGRLGCPVAGRRCRTAGTGLTR